MNSGADRTRPRARFVTLGPWRLSELLTRLGAAPTAGAAASGGLGGPGPAGGDAGGRLRGLLILGGLAAVLLIALGALAPPAQAPTPKARASAPPAAAAGSDFGVLGAAQDPLLAYERRLDDTVAGVLSGVAGAGVVSVAVTVSGAPEVSLARQGSASRVVSRNGRSQSLRTSRTDQVVKGAVGGSVIVTAERSPQVVGAVVVAVGAENPVIRMNLTEAVETLLGLSANQVMVLPGEPPARRAGR